MNRAYLRSEEILMMSRVKRVMAEEASRGSAGGINPQVLPFAPRSAGFGKVAVLLGGRSAEREVS